MVAVSAQLVPNADKVVDGVYVVTMLASGKEITEADLLALMGMNVDVQKSGYTIKVDAANLAARTRLSAQRIRSRRSTSLTRRSRTARRFLPTATPWIP